MMASTLRTEIISPRKVARIMNRLAYQIIERNRGAGNLVIFGIRKRGAALAEVLAKAIGEAEQRTFQVNFLDVTPFRDDIPEEEKMLENHSHVHTDVTDRDVILVDDVLFTGRTSRAALDAVISYGRPRTIQLVALIDRGHREYPIQPDYVGRMIPTKYRERIMVDVTDALVVYLEE